MNRYPNLSGINYESLVDGEGVRTAIFFSGCPHHCPGCHNPGTWNPESGSEISYDLLKEMADSINKRPFVKGITFSGGDPFMFPRLTANFMEDLFDKLHNKDLTLWIYTGWTFDELQQLPDQEAVQELLVRADVLVDGPFIEAQKDRRLKFRGSRNQNIIRLKNGRKT